MRSPNTIESIGLGLCIASIAITLFWLNTTQSLDELVAEESSPAAAALSVVSDEPFASAEESATTNQPKTMNIQDIKLGSGAEAQNGQVVAVHYSGRLDDGTEFDNSFKRGAPIEFTLGAGQVIAGWEEGILGMREGGERTLVIPPEKAYGDAGIGPIPGGATLTFTVELVEVK